MSSGKVTPAGRSLVMTRICGGCTPAGNRDRYTDNQCPWVKSRNMGALQHIATTRRVFESGVSLCSCRYSPPRITVTRSFRYRQYSVPPSAPTVRGVCALERMSCGLAVLTIAHRTYDRRTNDLNGSLTALATGEATLLVFSHILVSL